MSSKIRPKDQQMSGLQVPGQQRQQDNDVEMQNQDRQSVCRQDSVGQARAPIFSISRLTQMARTRTVDQSSPMRRNADDNYQQQQQQQGSRNGDGLDRRASRLRSQSSILSFGSQSQKPRIIDSEGDKFLRRFATNNNQTHLEKSQPVADRRNFRKVCLNFLSGNYVIDPAKRFHYRWLQLISLAVSYNIIFIVGRATFWNMHNYCPRIWYLLDYLCDFIYLLDMIAQSRTGYLEQGILVRQSQKLARHYVRSYAFKLDLISVIPTDLFYLLLPGHCQPNRVPCAVIVRLNRLLRFHRLANYFERTESATNFPFVFRISKLVFYILVIIHWNACVYFALSYLIGFGSDRWVYQPAVTLLVTNETGSSLANATNDASEPKTISSTGKVENRSSGNIYDDLHMVNDPLVHQYIYCFYWSTLTLTTIGEVPMPERDEEYLFVVIDLLLGMLIFATIVGNIGSMITSMNAARAEFQHKMDSVKQWMKFRKVNKELEDRIIKWFDYLWANRQTLDEDAVTAILPDRLKAETAIHVHLETLKRVQLFQDCEPGLLVQLVLKLKLQVFSPGDFICRVGDVGKEMYIVKRGELNVLSEDCAQVYGKLTDGSVFGELSILNISGVKTGNRRTANVRSVGYSDLFALSKQDLWQVLEDYPDAKSMLIDRGKEILRKDGLLVEQSDRSQLEEPTSKTKSTKKKKKISLDTTTSDCSTTATAVAIDNIDRVKPVNSDADDDNGPDQDQVTTNTHTNIMTNDRTADMPATLNKTVTPTSTGCSSCSASTITTTTTTTGANGSKALYQQNQDLRQDGTGSGDASLRTPSLFGLSGDSNQLEQLMMNFQQQQQQQQQLQKSFPNQQQQQQQRQASSQIPSRSSIIRKRQSLHAVIEGAQLGSLQQSAALAVVGNTSNRRADGGDGDDDDQLASRRSLDNTGDPMSFNDASTGVSQPATPKWPFPSSTIGPNQTRHQQRGSKMKKSLSFALPSSANNRTHHYDDDDNINNDQDEGVEQPGSVSSPSASRRGATLAKLSSRKIFVNNSIVRSGGLIRTRRTSSGSTSKSVSTSSRSLERISTTTRSCLNELNIMMQMSKQKKRHDYATNADVVCTSTTVAKISFDLMGTLDKLYQETSQTQAFIRQTLDKLRDDVIILATCQLQQSHATSCNEPDHSVAIFGQGKHQNLPTATTNDSDNQINNKRTASGDMQAESYSSSSSNVDLYATSNKVTNTPGCHLKPARPATANNILTSNNHSDQQQQPTQLSSSKPTGKLARAIALQEDLSDICNIPKGPSGKAIRRKLERSIPKTTLNQSQSDGCLIIDD